MTTGRCVPPQQRTPRVCAESGAPLTAVCPAPVTLSDGAAGTSVTRTIIATDGGAATATVSVDIDRVRPAVRVTKVRAGATHFALGPVVGCRATDRHSGVVTCKVTRRTKGHRIVYRAVATDRAGNTSSTRLVARTTDLFIRGAAMQKGHFVVHRGRTYTVLVKAATRPTYVFASNTPRPTARGGVPFKRIGKNTWALGVTFEHAMRHTTWWNIGIRVGTRTPVTDDRLCLASARARGGRAWWASNESLHATGRLCRTVPMRNLQRQRGSSSAAATHRRPVRPVLRFPVTGPRPAVARSTYMGSSGEHINADIAYIAGYEWALAVANYANCPRARLGSLPRADLASPHRE